MTDESPAFDWKSVFSERGHDAEPVEGPTGRDDDTGLEWFQVVTRFTQRGFMRAIVADDDQKVKVELQVALPGSSEAIYLDALTGHFERRGLSVDVVSEARPWTLDLEIDAEDELHSLIEDLDRLSEHVRRAEADEDIGALGEEWGSEARQADQTSTRGEEAVSEDDESNDASGPFESIGDEEPDEHAAPPGDDAPDQSQTGTPKTSGRARLGAFNLRVDDGAVVLSARADSQADDDQLDALARWLRGKLESRFDLVSLGTEIEPADDTAILSMEPSELGATYGMPLGDLCDDVARYLDRQRDLADMGVTLDKFSSPKPSRREDRSRRSRESTRDDAPRKSHDRRTDDEEDTGVVFGFNEADITAASPSESSLEPGDYTDPRVMREDATTALVDVVLRHPGYSDRNMRQVLSILLDVDYYRAGKLIDDAPCVIAWGVSQERAREFKRVIERGGGRVTLVEPDTLAEAE